MTGEEVHAFWRRFCLHAGLADDHPYQAWAFGDSPEMADELAELVIDGPKRATAGLVVEYEADGDPVPQAGDHSVILDGAGRPVAVIRATEVRVVPFAEVARGPLGVLLPPMRGPRGSDGREPAGCAGTVRTGVCGPRCGR